MRDFYAITFDNTERADEVLNKLNRLEKEYLIEFEDAVVAVKNEDGKVKLRQTRDVTPGRGAAGGALWGGLVGMLFFAPVLGAAVGAASGAISGRLTDLGIEDKFVKDVTQALDPGSSAIFVVVTKTVTDKVAEEFRDLKGKVYQTSLSKDAEEKLKTMLEQREAQPA